MIEFIWLVGAIVTAIMLIAKIFERSNETDAVTSLGTLIIALLIVVPLWFIFIPAAFIAWGGK